MVDKLKTELWTGNKSQKFKFNNTESYRDKRTENKNVNTCTRNKDKSQRLL